MGWDRLGSHEARKVGDADLGTDASDIERRPGKVQDEAVVEAGGAQVGADDGEMDLFEVASGFELDDDAHIDQQIEAMQPDLYTKIANRNAELTPKRDVASVELDAQRVVINGFDEAGS